MGLDIQKRKDKNRGKGGAGRVNREEGTRGEWDKKKYRIRRWRETGGVLCNKMRDMRAEVA